MRIRMIISYNNTYLARFACNETFTTSNGLTIIASVAPAPKPANEYVLLTTKKSTKKSFKIYCNLFLR